MSAATGAPENRSSPAAAIGSTNMLMIARYSGNTQRDVRRSDSDGVLHDGDVKLPRQADDRQRGQQRL